MKKRKRRKPHLRVKIGLWGEEAKPLEHKNDAERKSDLTKIKKIGVAGRYPVHTLCL